jgi:threonyl-tRNA synthetase
MERFCGVLIEHFAGAFPTWLSPEQVRVLTISEKTDEFARNVFNQLKAAGIRASLDDASEKIGAKIRSAQLEKIPYMLVIGQKEAEANSVSVRHRSRGDLGTQSVDAFLESVTKEVAERAL